jgi:hypothetical protein
MRRSGVGCANYPPEQSERGFEGEGQLRPSLAGKPLIEPLAFTHKWSKRSEAAEPISAWIHWSGRRESNPRIKLGKVEES